MEAIDSETQASSRELAEALEQQAATREILRLISETKSSAQSVFDTIAAAALRLCNATSANVFTFDGYLLHLVALARPVSGWNDPAQQHEGFRRHFPRPAGRDMAAPRAVLTGSVVMIPDVLSDDEYKFKETALADGFRSVLAVPLLRDGDPIGAHLQGRRRDRADGGERRTGAGCGYWRRKPLP